MAVPRTLHGTAIMVRLVLRLDRLRMPLWLVGATSLVLVSAASIHGLYQTPEQMASYARLVQDNAAMVVQAGPGHGLDDPTQGAILVNEVGVWTAIVLALMGVFLVGRHTRAEEESERTELLLSAEVGRAAPLASAVIVVSALQVLTGVAIGVGVVAIGFPVGGSLALAAASVGCGLVFTGIAAVAAQVTTASRGVTAIGGGLLLASFVLRAVGDVGNGVLSWLSPIGWAQAMRAFADERWWTLLLPVVALALLLVLATRLLAHRDFGGGLISDSPGPPNAAGSLLRPVGLAARLQRAATIGWLVGLMVLGFFYGVVADEADALFEDNPEMEQFFAQGQGGSITDLFLATGLLMVCLIASGFVVSSALRLRSEESSGRAEPLLSGALPRSRWVGAHVAVTVSGTVVLVAAAGAMLGAGVAVVTGVAGEVPRLTGAALVNVPALLVLAGVALALWGWVPRFAYAAWGAVAVVVIVGLFGDLLELPGWARGISPFHHTPAMPAEGFAPGPVLVLLAVAGALGAFGQWGFSRRDLG